MRFPTPASFPDSLKICIWSTAGKETNKVASLWCGADPYQGTIMVILWHTSSNSTKGREVVVKLQMRKTCWYIYNFYIYMARISPQRILKIIKVQGTYNAHWDLQSTKIPNYVCGVTLLLTLVLLLLKKNQLLKISFKKSLKNISHSIKPLKNFKDSYSLICRLPDWKKLTSTYTWSTQLV